MEAAGGSPADEHAAALQRLRVLADASHAFGAAPLDLSATLDAVASQVAHHIGDACSILLTSDDGAWLLPAVVRCRDPEHQRSVEATLARAPIRMGERVPGQVAATGRTIRIPVVTPQTTLEGTRPEYRAHLERYPILSLIAAPIRVGATILGALVITRSEPRPYTADDEVLVVDLADRAGLVIAHAQTYEAERAGRDRLLRLQALTSALGETLATDQVARITVEAGCRTIHAATGLFYILADGPEPGDAGVLTLIAQRGVPEEFLAPELRTIAADSALPAGHVLRTRAPVWVEDFEQYAAAWPELAAHAKASDRANAFAAVPLLVEGACLGVLAFGYFGAHRFAEGDRAFIAMLAHHCAQALQRARLVERDRQYHERLRLLAAAGELLTTTLDYEATLANVVAMAMPALADFCFLDLVEPGGAVRRICGAHEDEATLALLRTTRWTRAGRDDLDLCGPSSGRTGFHPKIDDAWMVAVATGPEHLALLRALGLVSMITVPLLSQGERLGALTLCHGRSRRRYTPLDVELAEELARRAAQAVRHARLLVAAEDATRRADAAGRVKDEFLATVSHELRTPLSVILGWATRLKRERPSEPATVQKGVDAIERNARAQLRIIEDILDVARIVRGELLLEPVELALDALVLDVVASVRPAAEAKGVAITVARGDAPCSLVADARRMRQIVWHLVSNAVKFTPASGAVTVSLSRTGDQIVLAVRDTGAGIDAAFLPEVFEPFRQADGSTTRAHGGLGLGLAIVRHLSEAHGGAVTAASAGRGQGSLFTVTLPARPPRAASPAGAPAPTGAPGSPGAGALAGLRVLVVDDDYDVREVLGLLLADLGARVTTAGSAEEALAAIPTFAPELLVSDIGMPVHDGYWLLEQARKLSPRLPAIALTAFARDADVQRARSAGFDQHVAKPVEPQQLAEVLARYRAASA